MGSEAGGAASVVDDIVDLAFVVEGDGDHVVEADVGGDGNLDGAGEDDVGMAEDAVDAEAPSFVRGDGVGYFVGGPAVGAWGAGIAGLVGWVVGDFGLVEVGAAAVAVPEDLELLVVFDEETVGDDVVSVDDEAVGADVRVPAYTGTVVGAPDPGMVDDGVVGVDLEVAYRATGSCSPTRKKMSWREMDFFREWLCFCPLRFAAERGTLWGQRRRGDRR